MHRACCRRIASLVYPWFSAEWVQDEFRTDRNRDQIEKTEDYSLGWRARAQLGFASTAIGSDRDASCCRRAYRRARR